MMKEARADSINPPDLIMHKNDTAPFEGVLINPGHYRDFTKDHMDLLAIDHDLPDIIQPSPLISGTEIKSFVFGIGCGIGLTFFALLILPH